VERFENRSGVSELRSFNNCTGKRVLDVLIVEAAVSGEIVIYLLFNIFIPAVNRPIVLTFVGLYCQADPVRCRPGTKHLL